MSVTSASSNSLHNKYNPLWREDPRLDWVAKGRSSDEAYCSYCQCYVNLRRQGQEALLAHGDLETHQFIMNYKRDGRIAGRDAPTATKADLTQRAEILWCIQVAAAGYPYHTANISGAFFLPVTIDTTVTMVIVNANIWQQLAKPIIDQELLYVLHFEESVTEAGRRALDIYVRYWSEVAGRVANILIGSHGIKRYDSEFTYHKCMEALERVNLPLRQLIYVSSHTAERDHLNDTCTECTSCRESYFQSSVYRSLNVAVCDSGGLPMIETITFNENVVYGAFAKVLHVLGEWGAEDIAWDLRAWFSTCKEPEAPFTALTEVFGNDELGYCSERVSNSRDTGLKTTYKVNNAMLYRHTLGLCKTFSNVIANWPALVKYFSSYVPNSERGIKKVKRFQRLHAAFTNNVTLLRFTYLRGIGQALDEFLDNSLFIEGPNVHKINSCVSKLIKTISSKFLRSEVRADVVTGLSHVKYEELDQQLPNDMINIGAPAGTIFKEVSALKLGAFYADVRTGYNVLFGYLTTRLPLTDPLVRGARALDPEVRQDKQFATAVHQLVKCLPQLVPHNVISKVLEEWDEYQTADIEAIQPNESVEEFWDRCFKMTRLGTVPKFRYLSRVIQVLLCMYYRETPGDTVLRHIEHRKTNKVAREFVNVNYGGAVSQTVINDSLVEAYTIGWEKYSSHYQQKGVMRQVSDTAADIFGDVTKSGFHGIKQAEYLVSEGVRRIDHGIKNDNILEVNGGLAMIEEARIKMRIVRTKLIHRQHLQDLDENNRLLSIGIYRVKQARDSGNRQGMLEGLKVLHRGLEGTSDIRMDIRPDSSLPHSSFIEIEEDNDRACCN